MLNYNDECQNLQNNKCNCSSMIVTFAIDNV